MRVCGQEFFSAILDRIKQVLVDQPSISRRALSRQVCEWLSWRTENGHWQEGSCRKALVTLHRQGTLHLPDIREDYAFHRRSQRTSPVEKDGEDLSLCCSLADLGPIDLIRVTSRYSRDAHTANQLLSRYHYLGRGSPCGAQIRYVIQSLHGPLGVLVFNSAAWALRERDEYIGWSEAARRAHLGHVVANSRFLLIPTVRVPNLASHVLALALRRLPIDWEARYAVRPVLVETFVDPTRFNGTSYQAANWIPVGYTAGRRDGIRKMIFLYPLCQKWRDRLCQEPPIRMGERHPRALSTHWVEEEFGTVCLYDPRLKARLFCVAQDFYNAPQASIPEACASKARTFGAYRFFQNKKVTMDVLLAPHTEATLERIRAHRVVLAPQDTTTLNYTCIQ